MATKAAIAVRKAKAQQRLETAVRALSRDFGVAIDEPAGVIRDPELARVRELETMADLLERITQGAAPATTTGAAATDQDAPDPQAKAGTTTDATRRATKPAKAARG